MRARGVRDQRAHARLDLGRRLLGDHPAVEAERDAVRHDVGVDAAFDAADDQRRAVDAGTDDFVASRPSASA
jgi:hypothetical protein